MKYITSMILSILCLLLLNMSAMAGDVNLSVAASMKDVINELTNGFVKKNPEVKFLKNYGASGALAKQIENGAPADIFISANLEWMDYLKNRKLVDTASVSPFAGNTLVFAGAAGKASSMQGLLKLEKIAIGSPKSVPAGEYAMAALIKAGIDSQLANKLVMARDVRDCLMYAERGEVDGAFVYRTDALLARQAKVLFVVPQDLYTKIVYPMVLTVTGAKNGDARSFYRFLQSDEAKTVLVKYGFTVR